MGYDMSQVSPPWETVSKINDRKRLRDQVSKDLDELRLGSPEDAEVRIGGKDGTWGIWAREQAEDGTWDDKDQSEKYPREAHQVLLIGERWEEAWKDETYFRANIFSMQVLRVLMDRVGILYVADYDYHAWPSVLAFGISEQEDPHHFNADGEPISPEAHRYEAAKLELRRHSPTPLMGIPSFKFGSNDGWWVTDGECQDAVARIDEWTKENGSPCTGETTDHHLIDAGESVDLSEWQDYWDRWVEYLSDSISTTGFEVW